MMASGHIRPGTLLCMYCAFMPNGWNVNITGAGVRPSVAEGTRTMNVRIVVPTSIVNVPDRPAVPSHDAEAGAADNNSAAHSDSAMQNTLLIGLPPITA